MPVISQAVVRTDDDPDPLTRIREETFGLAFPPRGTIRCIG
jgi:hypothetical protein